MDDLAAVPSSSSSSNRRTIADAVTSSSSFLSETTTPWGRFQVVSFVSVLNNTLPVERLVLGPTA